MNRAKTIRRCSEEPKTGPFHAVITMLFHASLKGQCHEMNNFFEGLKYQISTFRIGADGF